MQEFLEEVRRIADRIGAGVSDPELVAAVGPEGRLLSKPTSDPM